MISRFVIWWKRKRLERLRKLNEALRGETSVRVAFADVDAMPELKTKSIQQIAKLERRYRHKAQSARLSPERAAAWDALANRMQQEIERREAGGFLNTSRKKVRPQSDERVRPHPGPLPQERGISAVAVVA